VTKIFFAGAGTAGHVEPALAVAGWLRENRSDISCHFLGTAGGVENTLVPAADFPLHLITKAPFPRRPNRQFLLWPLRFKRTLDQTRELINGADLVIGFGGYVAAPAYLAARRAGIPIISHEANAKMGLANKLAKRCGALMLGAFSSDPAARVGIPLRPTIVELANCDPAERAARKSAALRALNLDPAAPTILIFGGSLGSVKFNETIASAQREISRLGFQIIHAVGGKNQLPQAQAGYLPISYIDDMAAAYAASDLVISRSGAVTVTETGALGIYTLYVPLPIGNGEQAENAKMVSERGGGEIIKNDAFTSAWLLGNIQRLITAAQGYKLTGVHMDFPLDASATIARAALKVLTRE
jgi:UDP-N-acetylglucosamine--N-acetylmuramyl-(pentapeptide) pyrophosphoryl-undecaprenol N-acetylglucosamine transferase